MVAVVMASGGHSPRTNHFYIRTLLLFLKWSMLLMYHVFTVKTNF